MQRLCTGTRVHRYTVSKQSGRAEKGTSGQAWGKDTATVHGYTGTSVHCEQTVRSSCKREGVAVPVEQTRMRPAASAAATTGSKAATRGSSGASSAAVMSLMLATAFAASITSHPLRANSRACG
jgi:hypothetical protein